MSTSDKMTPVNERIAEIIEHFQLSKAEFGHRTGILPQNVGKIVKGETEPSLKTLTKILENFPVSAEWLMRGEDQMLRSTPTNMEQAFQLQLDEKDRQIAELKDDMLRLYKKLETVSKNG
ncbi:MAG: helix-turn-helix transcriptional regulator [Bacteroidota bacterium]